MPIDPAWLLLSLQLPPQPAYLRVKLWRRLREAGALSLHGGMHALPDRRSNVDFFASVLAEARRAGGEGLLFHAAALGDGHAALEAQFKAVHDTGRARWEADAMVLLQGRPTPIDIRRMRRRLERIEAADFFGAAPADRAEDMLRSLAEAAARHPDVGRSEPAGAFRAPELLARTWVTRRNVQVDRIASAWLIRRFIDPRARFRFVDPARYVHQRRELRFDMSGGEFTHEGDACSFETLVSRGGLSGDCGLGSIAEIIHQLDIEDGKYNRPEAPPLAAALRVLCASVSKDMDRIDRATPLFDSLYEQLSTPR